MQQRGPHTVQIYALCSVLTPTRTKDIPLISAQQCGFPPRAILVIILPIAGSRHEQCLILNSDNGEGGVCVKNKGPLACAHLKLTLQNGLFLFKAPPSSF